jgi:hypothetical protein
MERNVALKRLRRMLGKNAGYRVDPTAPTGEQREKRERIARNGLAQGRGVESCASAPRGRARSRCRIPAPREAADKAGATARHHKITVGVSSELFFHVKAQGDSWEEIFRILEGSAR